MLDHDALQWFRENEGLTRENGQVFREKILSIGQSRDLGTAYREFRGKEPSVEPLLEHRLWQGIGPKARLMAGLLL